MRRSPQTHESLKFQNSISVNKSASPSGLVGPLSVNGRSFKSSWLVLIGASLVLGLSVCLDIRSLTIGRSDVKTSTTLSSTRTRLQDKKNLQIQHQQRTNSKGELVLVIRLHQEGATNTAQLYPGACLSGSYRAPEIHFRITAISYTKTQTYSRHFPLTHEFSLNYLHNAFSRPTTTTSPGETKALN